VITCGAKPRFWDCHEDLLRLAAWLRAQRIERYPAAIAEGKITREDAAADIRAWTAIEADWTHAVTLAPRAGPEIGRDAKLAALDIAVRRYESRAAAEPDSAVISDTLACIRALRWHAGNGRFLHVAAVNAARHGPRALQQAA
jgi:hypothetical protein